MEREWWRAVNDPISAIANERRRQVLQGLPAGRCERERWRAVNDPPTPFREFQPRPEREILHEGGVAVRECVLVDLGLDGLLDDARPFFERK